MSLKFTNLNFTDTKHSVFNNRGETEAVPAGPYINTPSITAPTNGAIDQYEPITITTGAFSVANGGSDTHASSDWQVSDDSGFSNIVDESLDDSSNKTSYEIVADLDPQTTYYVRARHTGTTYGDSAWSTTVSFTTAYVSTPSITDPTDTETGIGETPTITASAFATTAGSDTHASSDWQIASDSGFNTIVVQSLADASNKTSWAVPGSNLSESTTYYVRVRYNGTAYGTSAWSSTIEFTTTDTFVSYDTATVAFLSAMSTEPNTAVKEAIDALVTGLKSDAIWDNLDAFWPMNMPTTADSNLNLKDPSSFTLSTAAGSPTYVPYVGVTFNGANALDTGWIPSSSAVNYTLTSASFGAWCSGSSPQGNTSIMGLDQSNNDIALVPYYIGDYTRLGINSAGWTSVSGGFSYGSTGMFAGERTSSTIISYKNGAALGTMSFSYNGLSYASVYIGGLNNYGAVSNGIANQISCAFIGGYLGATKQTALYNRINTFRTAMAAAAP